nr:Hsp33 family molecular chaperone HslO [Pseudobdellovibrionaceae bacterium]
FQKQPHQGTVQLIHGEIGEDLAHYLKQSQQIRSILSLGVYLDGLGRVESAGGLLIEVMPGVEDKIIDLLSKNAEQITGSISEKIQKNIPLENLISPYLEGIPFTRLDHDYEVKYSCPCSKERVLRSFQILGVEELTDIIKKKESPQASCQMCGRKYQLTVDEVVEIRNQVQRESLH